MVKRNKTVQKTADLLRNMNTIGVDRNKMLKLYEKVFGTRYIDATVIEMAMDIAYQMGRNDEKSGRPDEPKKSDMAIVQLLEDDNPIARVQVPIELIDLVEKVWDYGSYNSVIHEYELPKVEDLSTLL